MHSVLLVDDEYTVIEGLRQLFDWESAGFKIIGEAYDGDDAFEKISATLPDLVLADIRMPGLSGLDLIKAVREKGITCEFIIVSGYADFNYCLEALRLEVSDYILKPIDFSLFSEKLGNVAKKIRYKKEENEFHHSTTKFLTDVKSLKLYKYFSSLFYGIDNKNIIDAEEKKLLEQYSYVVCAAKHYDECSKSLADTSKLLLNIDFAYHMQIKSTHIFILGFRDKKEMQNSIDMFIHGLRSSLKTENNTLAVAKGIVEKFENLAASLRKASECVDTQVFYQASYDEAKYGMLISKDNLYINKEIDLLINSVRFNDKVKLEEIFEKLFFMFKREMWMKSDVIDLINEIAVRMKNMLIDFASQSAIKLPEFVEERLILDYREGFNTSSVQKIDEIKELFKGYICKCMSHITTIESYIKNPLILKIKEYIKIHYMENLTLQSISNVFHLNPSYLCRIFKEKQDMNFTDYINKIRVEKGKELLALSDSSVVEISEKLGFSDYRYFIRVFKKYEGVTPHVYKLMMNEKVV